MSLGELRRAANHFGACLRAAGYQAGMGYFIAPFMPCLGGSLHDMDAHQLMNRLGEAGHAGLRVPSAAGSAGQAIAINMPMTVEAVVAYFGIVLAGCAVVCIWGAFGAAEIATRRHLARAVAIVTQV